MYIYAHRLTEQQFRKEKKNRSVQKIAMKRIQKQTEL